MLAKCGKVKKFIVRIWLTSGFNNCSFALSREITYYYILNFHRFCFRAELFTSVSSGRRCVHGFGPQHLLHFFFTSQRLYRQIYFYSTESILLWKFSNKSNSKHSIPILLAASKWKDVKKCCNHLGAHGSVRYQLNAIENNSNDCDENQWHISLRKQKIKCGIPHKVTLRSPPFKAVHSDDVNA